LMTLRNAPLSARDGRLSAPDLPDMLSEIFLRKGLDRQMSDLPVRSKSLGPVRQIAPEQLVIPGRAPTGPRKTRPMTGSARARNPYHHREYRFRACAKRRIHDAQLRNGE
jgi:hypothetical protein